MKTTVGVFFGGRSTEHEISVISALQAINAFNKEKYEIIPIYITKQGRWFSGDALLEVKNYRDMAALQNMCAENTATTTSTARKEPFSGTIYGQNST